MRTENITQRNQSNDWKQYLPNTQVDEAVVQAIEETLFRNHSTFQQATEANKRFIIHKLVKLFGFKSASGYKISPERVYLLNLKGQVVVSLHYLVYLKLAAESGVIVVRFERFGEGEKVILRSKSDDIEREYFLDYAQYKNRGGVWQTHFDVMFRKTLLKQAIMFLFADIYENEVFSEVANLEEDDLVEPAKPSDEAQGVEATQVTANGAAKVDIKEARKKNTKLYAKINQLKAIFASDKELLREYEAFLRLRGYKSALDITDENELKDLHALAEALAEHKKTGVAFGDALDLRDKVLLRLMNAENKAAIKPQILSILSQYGYDTISEVGRMEVLEKLYSLVENQQNIAQNGTEKAQDRLF